MQWQSKSNQLVVAVGYVTSVLLSVWGVQQLDSSNLLRYPLALLPLVPIGYGVILFLRYVRTLDELQQHIHLEALAFSTAITAGITFTFGFLENVGFPRLGWIWIFPMLLFGWGVGQCIAARRYS
jgi:hypothetical protein